MDAFADAPFRGNPAGVCFLMDHKPDEWLQKLNRIISVHKNRPFLSVVIFNETGDGYDSVNDVSAGLGVNAFYLQGGVAAYKKYLADLTLSWLPRDRRIRTNRKCKICSGEIEAKTR